MKDLIKKAKEEMPKSTANIIIGKYDDIIVVAKDRIFEQINKNC